MGGINTKTCEIKKLSALSKELIPIAKIPELFGIKQYMIYKFIRENKLQAIEFEKITCIKKNNLEKFINHANENRGV